MAEGPLLGKAAAAAQAAARYEARGQLQEAAGQYEVAARGLMQAMHSGGFGSEQLRSFRDRASQYVDRIEAIRSGSALPHEPPPASQLALPAPVVPVEPVVVVVPGEYSPTVQPGPNGDRVSGHVSPHSSAEFMQVSDDHRGSVPEGAAVQPVEATSSVGKRRFHIMREILTTERTFVQTLGELVQCYYKPIRCAAYAGNDASLDHSCCDVEVPQGTISVQSDVAPPTLSVAELNVLFHPSLLQILPRQVELLHHLESAWAAQAQPDNTIAPDFSQQFEDFLPQLLLYTDYIANYKKAAALHSSLAAGAGGTARREQLAMFEQSVEQAGSTPLSSSLITPVQRLTRYEMLFKELLQHTNTADERARTEHVLTEIAATNVAINETLRAQSRVMEATELLGSLLHPPPPTNALAKLGNGDVNGLRHKSWVVRTHLPPVCGHLLRRLCSCTRLSDFNEFELIGFGVHACVYCPSQVAIRAHDPPDPRKIPAAIFKAGVLRVQAREVLELLQTEGGPVPHWWRVRRCCLTDRLSEQREDMEGWILAEYTKRVHADQVGAWLDRAVFRDRNWATAAHRVLSRLRNPEGAEPGSGRELLRNSLLQEWDPLRRRVQNRRFILLSGCLLKVSEVPQQMKEAESGRSSRWRRSTCASAHEDRQELASSGSLVYCDSIDLTDEGISI
eukprot:COSAG02_NODE_9707_length_2136_cov_3.569465_1_plen_676_part_01